MADCKKDNSSSKFFDFADYIMPIRLKEDKEYLPELKKKLGSLSTEIRRMGFDDEANSRLLNFSKDIVYSIETYLKGNLIDVFKIVEKLLAMVKDERQVVTYIRHTFAFPGRENTANEVQLFRARHSH